MKDPGDGLYFFNVAGDEDTSAAAAADDGDNYNSDTGISFSSSSDDDIGEVETEREEDTGPPPVSGVFHSTASGATAYAAFFPDRHPLPDPSLSFLPEPVTVAASAAGLLCCRGRSTNLFYVCNPLTTFWAPLPAQTNHPGLDAVVLLPDDRPSDSIGNVEYQLVCPYPIKIDGFDLGVYGVECFDSRKWEWTLSSSIVDANMEKIVPGSGVAVGRAAYWRIGKKVVVYVPSTDEFTMIVPPEGFGAWMLGELEGRLCCTSVGGSMAMVWVLDSSFGGWKEERVMEVGPDQRVLKAVDWPSPVRSQCGSELLFWEGLTWGCGRHLVARDVTTTTARRLIDNAPRPGDVLVPYTSSLAHFRRERIDKDGEGDECGKTADGKVDLGVAQEVDIQLIANLLRRTATDESWKTTSSQMENNEHKPGKVDFGVEEVEEYIYQDNLEQSIAKLKDYLGRSIADACTEEDGEEKVKNHHSNCDQMHQSTFKSSKRKNNGSDKLNDDANDVPSKRRKRDGCDKKRRKKDGHGKLNDDANDVSSKRAKKDGHGKLNDDANGVSSRRKKKNGRDSKRRKKDGRDKLNDDTNDVFSKRRKKYGRDKLNDDAIDVSRPSKRHCKLSRKWKFHSVAQTGRFLSFRPERI